MTLGIERSQERNIGIGCLGWGLMEHRIGWTRGGYRYGEDWRSFGQDEDVGGSVGAV